MRRLPLIAIAIAIAIAGAVTVGCGSAARHPTPAFGLTGTLTVVFQGGVGDDGVIRTGSDLASEACSRLVGQGVQVRNQRGALVAHTRLSQAPTPDSYAADSDTACTVGFALPVTRAVLYRIDVASLATPTYGFAELKARHFHIELGQTQAASAF